MTEGQNEIPQDYENFETDMLNELQSSTTNSRVSPLNQGSRKPREESRAQYVTQNNIEESLPFASPDQLEKLYPHELPRKNYSQVALKPNIYASNVSAEADSVRQSRYPVNQRPPSSAFFGCGYMNERLKNCLPLNCSQPLSLCNTYQMNGKNQKSTDSTSVDLL